MHGSRSQIPNKKSRPYIYDVKFLALLEAPFIYDISRLRVNKHFNYGTSRTEEYLYKYSANNGSENYEPTKKTPRLPVS
jgi:hypothetical protein